MYKKFKSHFYLQKQTKIKVNNIEINYLKVGNGPQTLLLLPGTLGSLPNILSTYYTIHFHE